jgi:nicotinamide mononucleotide (NMN) deamidase PncC
MNLVEKLIDKNLTISAAESLTGGLFQATVVSMEHASKVFWVVWFHILKKLNVNC